jgi:dTDP-4-dehydrorhamnose 3,5-epimerase
MSDASTAQQAGHTLYIPPMRIEELSVRGEADPQLVRSDWSPVGTTTIDGVATKLVTNVLTGDGYLTEMWRTDWELDDRPVDQVFQRLLYPGAISAWHTHLITTDRLFCAAGHVLVVLYDARPDSSTHGVVTEYRLGEARPAVISLPPGIYHGVRNVGPSNAVLLNAVDAAYDYEAPDHYRVPRDSEEIPYTW